MTNLQVENLDEVLTQLKRRGVDVDPRVESYDCGKFGWIMDMEANRVELWEPKKNSINKTSVARSSLEN
jgi:D-3-phosphoglycerate dehydrogenase / 2-oxoglutarate reductase